jgi:hypothetical protein
MNIAAEKGWRMTSPEPSAEYTKTRKQENKKTRKQENKKTRVRLSGDIFEAWKENDRQNTAVRELVGEMRTAFNFRDWIAHGRHWVKPTGKHDFDSIYLLAENVLNAFALREPD